MALTRKEALKAAVAAVAAGTLPQEGEAQQTQPTTGAELTAEDLKAYERVAGIEFSEEERTQALRAVNGRRQAYNTLRKQVPDGLPDPRTLFTPIGGGSQPGSRVQAKATPVGRISAAKLDDEAIAFLNVRELGALLRSKQITPTRLTKLYLERLKRYGDKLLCLVTLTEDLALEQAARAEAELNAGKIRGPLHGIPYGAKDLFATKGIPTQWGADPYQGQMFDHDAAVVERLQEAGAILCAKLSLGSLAMGDVWNKGTTKNPWNPKEGSSGSSAGSACATAAGLVAFGIGTETQGSITSPSLQCRLTGLRPTYGRVSRYGAM
ncbi:MAG TPA: amidase, partial [Chthonomonadaceae bacterium]|nr:amidase [Chthonomonadaceae bacterium]